MKSELGGARGVTVTRAVSFDLFRLWKVFVAL